MASRDEGLLSQIESDVLDGSKPVSATLNRVIMLGERAGSPRLRGWASRELRGYKPEDELPPYRVVNAPLKVNGLGGGMHYTGQQISPSSLPDFAQSDIKEEVRLLHSIGEIEAMITSVRAQRTGELHLADTRFHDLARYMNSQRGSHITEMYWAVSTATLTGVIEQARTTLAELVGELRAATPTRAATPSPEATTQAVNVSVYGRSRVRLHTAQSAGRETAHLGSEGPSRSPWRRTGGLLVGVASVLGAFFGWAQWQNWDVPGF